MKFQFRFDVQAMLATLPVMLYGMLGGMLVMAVICGVLMLLYQVGKRKKKA